MTIGRPAAGDRVWSCEIGDRMVLVVACSWFAARVAGMARLGCGPGELTVREVIRVEGAV